MKLFLHGEKKSSRPPGLPRAEFFRASLIPCMKRILPGHAALYIMGLAACLLDNITTAIALSRPGFVEGRMGSRILIGAFGLQGGLIVKAVMMGLLCIGFLYLAHQGGFKKGIGFYGLSVVLVGLLQVGIMNTLLLFVY